MQNLIRHFLNMGPKEARLLMIKMQAQQVGEAFSGLPKLWVKDPVIKNEMDVILKEFRKLQEKRNAYAHGSWQQNKDRNMALVFFPFKGIEQRIFPKTDTDAVGDIKKLNLRYRKLETRLRKLHLKLGAPLP